MIWEILVRFSETTIKLTSTKTDMNKSIISSGEKVSRAASMPLDPSILHSRSELVGWVRVTYLNGVMHTSEVEFESAGQSRADLCSVESQQYLARLGALPFDPGILELESHSIKRLQDVIGNIFLALRNQTPLSDDIVENVFQDPRVEVGTRVEGLDAQVLRQHCVRHVDLVVRFLEDEVLQIHAEVVEVEIVVHLAYHFLVLWVKGDLSFLVLRDKRYEERTEGC